MGKRKNILTAPSNMFDAQKNVFVMMFVVVITQAIINVKSPLTLFGAWQANEMTFDYSYGFICRGLMGSIATFLSDVLGLADRLTVIIWIQLIGEIVFVSLVVMISVYFIRHNKSLDCSGQINWFILLFFAAGAVSYYFIIWGEPDIYMISLTILSCFAILKDRMLWIVPLFSVICVFIHEGYVLMYFGIILVLVFYKFATESTTKKKIYFFIILFLTLALTGGFFIYFYFFSAVKDGVTLTSMLANTNDIIGEHCWERGIKYIYFSNTTSFMWDDGRPNIVFALRMFAFLAAIALYYPLIRLVMKFWIALIKNEKQTQKRFIYFVCFAGVFLTVPLFLLQTDFGRWAYDVMLYEVIVIMMLISFGDKHVINTFRNEIKLKNPISPLLLFLYVLLITLPDEQYINSIFPTLFY